VVGDPEVRRAMRQQYTEQGGHIGAIPYGYRPIYEKIGERRDGTPRLVRRLEPDPDEAPVVAEIYRLRALGYSVLEIRRLVNLPRPRSSYTHMLDNPIYAGRWSWGDLGSDELVPALVDPDLWERVYTIQTTRREQANHPHPRRERSSYLLSGLLHCGACGLRMNGKTTTPPVRPGQERAYIYRFYECSSAFIGELLPCQPRRRFRAELADERVLARLRSILTTPEILADLHARLRANVPGPPPARSDAQDLARVRFEIDNITRAIADGAYTRALARKQAELEEREAGLLSQVRRPARRPAPAIPETIDAAQLAVLGIEAWRAVENAAVREQQLFLRALVQRVTVVKTEAGELNGSISLRELPGLGDASGLVLPL